MDSRAGTAVAGLVVSLAVSVAAWYYFDTLLVFLVLPFVPILFRGASDREARRSGRDSALRGREGRNPTLTSIPTSSLTPTAFDRVKQCPRCGFQTRDEEYAYCPRDGTRLDTPE